MAAIEAKLAELGLVLPEPTKVPQGVVLPFSWVRIHGDRAFLSGHVALNPDGSLAGPFGKVGEGVSLEEAYGSAKLAALAMLASLKRTIGDLDRVNAWLRVFGMVNTGPTFNQTPAVIDRFSDLILDLYGPERGAHTRSAVGMAMLPFGTPVEIEAEVAIE